MLIRVEHTTSFTYAEPHLRGVHGATPTSALERRPALHLLPARHRSARRAGARLPRPARQRRPAPRGARGSRPDLDHRAQRGQHAAPCSSDSAPRTLAAPGLRLPRTDGVRAVLGAVCASCQPTAEGHGTETERAVEVMRTDARPARLRAGSDRRDDAGRRGARARPGRLPGLRARDARRLPPGRDSVALRQRLPLRPARAGRGRRRTPGWTSSTPSAAGSRSTRRTTASRPRRTSASPSAATTRTCRRREASSRERPRRRSTSPCGSRSSERAARQRARRLAGRGVRPLARRPAAAGVHAGRATDLSPGLLTAGQHGEEADTALLVRRLLERIPGAETRWAVIPVLNPDGLLAGTRQNAAGVDLNRNFPSATWEPDATFTFPPGSIPRSGSSRTGRTAPRPERMPAPSRRPGR